MEPSLPAVFSAGVLSFASPCVLPMVPIYLATLSGATVSALSQDPPRGRLVLRASAFALGLAVPFVLLGLAASGAGRLLAAHRASLAIAGGALVILFGLKQLRVLNIPWLERDVRPGLDRVRAEGGLLGALLFGAAFGLGWTPCVGPVLGAVLTWTAQANASPLRGALTLAVYAAGLALPLIVAGAFAPTALRALRRVARHAIWVERVSGLALVLSGIWLITQQGVAPSVVSRSEAAAAPCAEAAVGCGLPGVASAEGVAAPTGAGVVEFVRRDCPACERMAPVVRAAERRCAVAVRRVLVDEPEGMAQARAAGVLGVPTFVGRDAHGGEVARLVGVHPESTLVQLIEERGGRRCGP